MCASDRSQCRRPEEIYVCNLDSDICAADKTSDNARVVTPALLSELRVGHPPLELHRHMLTPHAPSSARGEHVPMLTPSSPVAIVLQFARGPCQSSLSNITRGICRQLGCIPELPTNPVSSIPATGSLERTQRQCLPTAHSQHCHARAVREPHRSPTAARAHSRSWCRANACGARGGQAAGHFLPSAQHSVGLFAAGAAASVCSGSVRRLL